MEGASAFKSDRLLQIYSRLVGGEVLNKRALARQFNVTERSIQRDIESLRCFFAEQQLMQDVIYDKRVHGYRLENAAQDTLSNSEILAVCKILLESRSMRRDEMMPILDKLIARCVPESSKKAVTGLILNERHHYIPPRHDTPVLGSLWEIGQAVDQRRVMQIEYTRLNGTTVHRTIEPVGLMFSEYYFYLVGFLREIDRKERFENPDDLYPTIYRVDRIQSFAVTDERFTPAYATRFQEGEFRKRVQFMFGGTLNKIKFRYTGPSIEAVLDRLPTAKIIKQDEDGWDIEAEVFGKGIEMWLRGQGETIAAAINF